MDGAAEVRIPRTEEKVVVIVHQHERMHRHPEAFGEFGQAAEEAAPIVVGAEDAFAAVAPIDDMVPAVGHPHAQGSSDERILPIRRQLSMLRM